MGWSGDVAAGIAIISELLWLPIYPAWSILLITLYVSWMIGPRGLHSPLL
jgi:hypothetical protein